VIINAITKSGTNQVHGRGFYYYQDEKLNAQNYLGRLQHRRPDHPQQGVLLLQLREDRPEFGNQRPVPAGSGAAGHVVLDVVRRQPDQLFRPRRLPGDAVKPRQLPRRLRT
jgi:hypothetical protein